MALLLEEPDEWNDYLDPASPRAWRLIWIKVQVLLPIWLFSLLCSWEMVAFAAWGRGAKWSEFLWPLALMSVVVSIPIGFGVVASLRFGKRSKSSIEITPEGISASSLKFVTVPWERVMVMAIDEMRGAPGMAMLRVKYAPGPPSSFLQIRIVIPLGKNLPLDRRKGLLMRQPLACPRQVELLREELQRLRQSGKSVPILTEQQNPPMQVRWLYLEFLGLYLLLHGGPLLMIGLQPVSLNSHPVHSEAGLGTKLAPMLAKHFHSLNELRRFFINVGAALAMPGATLFAAGFIMSIRQRKAVQFAAERSWLGKSAPVTPAPSNGN